MATSTPAVLLVEGDIVVRHPLAEYLRECGFTVFEASNGEEAKRALLASSLQFSVVLADVMTDGSGFALQNWMQELDKPPEIILAASIEKVVDNAATVCQEGPALAKPYAHHLVLDHIRRVVAQRDRAQIA